VFIDARTLPGNQKLEADLCIVGAGPAGVVLAIALAGEGRRIALVESGGYEADAMTQALNEGESIGLSYRISESRLRYLGGSGNHWAGNCRPLSARNFAERDWIPHSGWPFGLSELNPYYVKARRLCGTAQHGSGIAEIIAAGGFPVPWSAPLETAIWQVSPVKCFGERFRLELANAPGITVLLNANLTQLVCNEDGRSIASARFSTLTGISFAITARNYVLACGGIENPRLLLAMASEQHPGGLGNEHDLVGRFFTEHPEIRVGALIYNHPIPTGIDHVVSNSAEVFAEGFRVDDEFQCSARIADVAFWPLRTADATNSIDLASEFGPLIQNLSSRLAGRIPIGPRAYSILTISFEQAPNPNSRVTLAEARDVLGMRRLRLDWRLNDLDGLTFASALKLIGRETGRQRIGRFWLRPPFRGLDLDRPESIRFDIPILAPPSVHNQLDTELRWGCHHMGTTRMHVDPRYGVVDEHARVHGLCNLYIAGSSVFPSAGLSNPTLTILALVFRLADHLRKLG
jgi:choline dehydrogenase-like flavoprotein